MQRKKNNDNFQLITIFLSGKTPGKDAQENKATYVSFYGIETSKKQVASLCKQACDILKSLKVFII